MSNHREKVRVEIDGRQVEADYRAPLIEVARKIGVSIPTLCHHEALEPAGACRLCLVEEVRDGWSKFVTACNYPVEDGMVFRTSSKEVLQNRRMTLEALLARCPEVPVVKDLAQRMGVDGTRFAAKGDTCILCGMCTRVCESYATSAISMISRGVDKSVGTFAGEPPEDCVGCGSCAKVCPTGHIEESRGAGSYTIWDRTFDVAVCGVDGDRCIGCGACEEACPFSVARVVLQSDGTARAEIDPVACRGCGVCLGACPSGAVAQPRVDRTLPETPGRLLVIACGRANLANADLPDGVVLMEMRCAGGANAPTLVGALARGFEGVLVLGRHQSTCRLDGAEVRARDVVRRSDELAVLCGLGEGRIAFAEPDPGPGGPLAMVQGALDSLEPSPLKDHLPADAPTATLEDGFEIVRWLGARKELEIDPSGWLDLHDLPAASGDKALDAGPLPYYDILLSGLLEPADLGATMAEALALAAEESGAEGILVGPLEAAFPIPNRDRIREIRDELSEAFDRGKEVVEADCLEDLAGYLIAVRTGSWRRAHVRAALSTGGLKAIARSDQVSR